jgi:hypothetical protein
LEKHEACYVRILDAAKSKHEIAPNIDTRGLARDLLATVFGMQVLARASAAPEMILAVAENAIRSLGCRSEKKQ